MMFFKKKSPTTDKPVESSSSEIPKSSRELRTSISSAQSPVSKSTAELPQGDQAKPTALSQFSTESTEKRRSFFGKRVTSPDASPSFVESIFGSAKQRSPLTAADSDDSGGDMIFGKEADMSVNTSLGSLDNLSSSPNAASPISPYTSGKRGQKTRSSTSNRFSTRFKDAFSTGTAVDEHSDVMSISFSVDAETIHTKEDESIDDDESSIGLSQQLRQIGLYIKSSKDATQFKARPKSPISEVILDILKEVLFVEDLNPEDAHNWKICKIDRNMLVTRVWLAPEQSLNFYKINDGDELRLKNSLEEDELKIQIPPHTQVHNEAYKFEETVKDFIDRLKQKYELKEDQNKFGLYYKKIGLWLDEKRTLSSYEIESEHAIELRHVAQEFFLRVQLPEVDTRFTIKVLPSLTVADVVGLIVYNLSSKRITLDAFRRGGEDVYTPPFSRTKPRISEVRMPNGRKLTQYGLFLPSRNVWLSEGKMLEEYQLSNMQEELHFSPQYHPITISIPPSMAYNRNDLLRTVGTEGKGSSTNLIQIFASDVVKVKDLLAQLNLDNPDHREAIGDSEEKKLNITEVHYGLFTRGNDRLKEDSLVWDALKDVSALEIIEYRMVSKKLTVTCSQDLDVKLELDVDFSKPVEEAVTFFCRRFGVSRFTEFKGIHVVGSPHHLDLKKSFIQSRIAEGSTVVIELQKNAEVGVVYPQVEGEDVNIWLEPEDNSNNIQFAQEGEKIVTASTLNKLVEHLTAAEDRSESTQYLDFMKTFLLTYQSFTTPTQFLKKLIERYHVPRQKDKDLTFQEFDKLRTRVQLRCLNVLQQWTKKYYFDFVDSAGVLNNTEKKTNQALAKHALLIQVLDFAESDLVHDHPALAKQIRKNVLRLRDGSYVNQAQIQRQSVASPVSMKLIKPQSNVIGGEVNIFQLEAEVVAQQFTILEFDLFVKIMPYEFLNQAWTKADADERAPNIINVTKRFNEIAFWVAKSVLEVKTVKARSRRLARLIDVAGYLYIQNNFSTLMAFIAGFNKAAVTRLKHTFKEMNAKSQRKLQELERIMSAESSYKSYRGRLHSVQPPCIPYVGVYLLDLTYMEDGNPNKVNGLINFAKRRLINTLIREVQQYQDQPYVIKPIDDVIHAISKSLDLHLDQPDGNTMKGLEDQLFNLSLQREPRNAERNSIQ